MDQAPPLETVYQAVNTLYNNPNTSEKEKASHWLGELQKSVFSWKIADEMLRQKRDLESCYFAAQTMRTKIQNSFCELPPEVHFSLRDSLLEHISQITESTSAVIVTQLCLALADLALQMTTWQKPVLDLISKFSPNVIWPLLEILTVLPEELSSRSLRLGANRRSDVVADLMACAPTVNELLRVCITNSGDNITIDVKIIRCFTSWVSVNAISLDNVVQNVVFLKAFQVLGNHQSLIVLHDAAADCICTLLQCLEDNNNQLELENRLFTSIMMLEEPYHLSVANEDQEKSINYCRVFTELAEALLDKIVINSNAKSQHYGIKIFNLVLVCVGHHDYEVAEITFNLWYRLSEELYQKNSDTLTAIFRPYIERLLNALCRHAQMEPDHEGLLEDGDDFKDFRQKVSDLIKDVVFIVGSSNCFRQMFLSLQTPDVTWDRSEAALFVMQTVAKNILPEENEVVPKVVEAILSLPENTHPAVRYTSLLLLGELCEWVDHHNSSLEPILNFLLHGLQRPGLAGAAANALQNICSACRQHMPAHFIGLLQIVQQIDTFSITNEQVTGLLRGIAVILGCMPSDQVVTAMRELCMLQINPLVELIENDFVPVRGTKSDPIIWLDRLSAIFRNTNISVQNGEIHPCQTVINEMWPILSRVCDKYQSDLRIMERCCRCLRFAIRCIGKQGSYLVRPLVEQMTRQYETHKHSCYLYLGSILVDEYATDTSCAPVLVDMLTAFIKPTFERLQEENGLKNHPDTVDDFFRLCTRFLQRAPVDFLQCPALPGIVQCALMACNLDHKEANTSIMKFFGDLIITGKSYETRSDFEVRRSLVESILQQHGQTLVTNLIHATVFYLHSYMLSDVAEVLLELQTFNRATFSVWLENAINSLPTQSNNGCITVTPNQLLDFHVSVIRSDSTKSICHALRDFTRLYR